jgi:hypothetical protein
MILIAGGAVGLLFGIHPLHVESVVWVAERKDLLCALFFMLSIFTYSAYAAHAYEGDGPQKSYSRFFHKQYLLAIGLFILALLSKPMAVSLPVVLLILDWYPFRRIRSVRSFRAVLVEKLPFILLSLAVSTLIFLAHRAQAAMAGIDVIPASTRLLVAASSLIAYLGKMIWPVDLIPYYPYPDVARVSLFSFKYLYPVVLVTGITCVGAVVAQKRPLWSAVWAYYIVTLIPVLGIVQVGPQAMADRFTYLPSLGPFLVIGIAAALLSKKATEEGRRRPTISAVSTVTAFTLCLTLSFLTYQQIQIWRNGIDLWSYVIKKEPVRAYIAYNNRGVCFEKMGLLDKAVDDYNKTLVLHPSDDQANFNLGVVYQKAGLIDKAIEYYDDSLAVNPDRAEAYHNRGVAYSGKAQFERALDDFDKAIALNDKFGIAFFNRGGVYFKTGRLARARSDFQRACAQGISEACTPLEETSQVK